MAYFGNYRHYRHTRLYFLIVPQYGGIYKSYYITPNVSYLNTPLHHLTHETLKEESVTAFVTHTGVHGTHYCVIPQQLD
jgi:hypothetical protein